MQIRTITGTSISDALAEARSLWGDEVVMLQAQPPSPGERAQIAVALPAPQTRTAVAAVSAGAALATQATASPGAALTRSESPASPLSSIYDREAPMNGSSALDLLLADAAALATGKSPASEMLVTPPPGALRRPRRATGALLEKNIRPATEVFDHISTGKQKRARVETGTNTTVETDERDPTREPLFAHLIRHGIRPRRAQSLAEISVDEDIRAAVTALAGALPPKVRGRAPGRVLFIGDAGAGKTSLVLRSALSRIRAGRTAPAIVVVAPDQAEMRGWQDPTVMFEACGLNVIRCSREALPSALNALEGEVLVDTPAGFNVPSTCSLHIRQVIDARPAQSATAREGDGADSVVVTHVDKAPALGYLTERLIAMGLPVAALVRTGRPEGQIEAYDPEAFATLVCHA